MKKTDLLLAILMCISWSSDYIVTKKALEFFSPIFFSSVRFFIVSLLILPKLKRIPPKIMTLAFVSFPLVVLVYGAVDIAIKMNSSITATNIVVEFHVITSIIAAYIFLGEKLTKKQIHGMIIAFIGVLIVILANTINNPLEIFQKLLTNQEGPQSSSSIGSYFNRNNMISLIFLFISVMSWPIYAIFSKKLSNDGVKESEIIGWTAFFGSFFGLIVSFIFEKNQIQSVKTAGILELSYFLYAALFGVLIPHAILHYLIRIYDVCKISVFSLLVPFFTALGGIIFFGEKITFMLASGGILLIFGIYITQFSGTKKKDVCEIISPEP